MDKRSLEYIDYNTNIQRVSGLSFESVQEINNKNWKLLDNVETGRGLAIFQQLPNIIKQVHDNKSNEGAYEIIFDKGLGTNLKYIYRLLLCI